MSAETQQAHREMRKLMDGLNKVEKMVAGSPSEGNLAVIIGFSQWYSRRVHDDEKMPHKTGESGFLLKAVNELRGSLQTTIARVFKRNKDLAKALIVAGNQIKRLAQQKTPVDTGALRRSAYVGLEGTDAVLAMETSFAYSEERRLGVKAKRAIRGQKRRDRWLNKVRGRKKK